MLSLDQAMQALNALANQGNVTYDQVRAIVDQVDATSKMQKKRHIILWQYQNVRGDNGGGGGSLSLKGAAVGAAFGTRCATTWS